MLNEDQNLIKEERMKKAKTVLTIFVMVLMLIGVTASINAAWIKCKDNFSKCTEGGCESPSHASSCTLYNCGMRNVICEKPTGYAV
jgi:hypothetical protein